MQDKRVLIVEDESIVAMEIEERLKTMGYCVVGTVVGGEEAISVAEREKPNIILMDIILRGELDGVATAEIIHKNLQLPIVYLTAHSDEATLQRAKTTQPYGYVIKPFNETDLYTAIEMALYKHQAEIQLRHSEKILSTTLNNISDAVITCLPDTTIRFLNRTAQQMSNTSIEEALGKPVMEVFSNFKNISGTEYMNPIMHILNNPDIGFDEVFIYSNNAGQNFPVKLTSSTILTDEGTVEGLVLVLHNVEESLKSERLKARMDMVIDQAAELITIIRPGGEIIYVNPAFELITGYSQDEVISKNAFTFGRDILGIINSPEIKDALMKGDTWKGDVIARHKKGHNISLESIFSPLVDSRGRVVNVVVLGRDVSTERRLAEQLRQAQKLEAVGQLAGGIAHDFNNLLTVINGYAEFALGQTENLSVMMNALREIQKAGKRAASLTSQLLGFSRKQIMKPREIDVNQIIRETDKMLNRLIGEDISITMELAPDLKSILADPGQIQQILINLTVNARDAIRHEDNRNNNKMIVIGTSNFEIDEDFIKNFPGSKKGRYIRIRFQDNGIGIEPKLQDKIFEPFFTTKEVGEGTGLGLSMIYGIVKQNHGNIYVESEKGKGTCFYIYWPVLKQTRKCDNDTRVIGKLARGHERVLVVEDDISVREFAVEALRSLGYVVFEASDGVRAIDKTVKENLDFDILMTDIVMPDMGGRELAERMQELRPGVKVLFTSGYTDDSKLIEGVIEKNLPFLQKPYSVSDLTSKLRNILDN